jgi:hypothetical protein
MALKLYTSPTGALKVYATDYKKLIRELNKVDKTQSLELRRRYREIAAKGQRSIKSELDSLGRSGPAPKGMLHGGRTGWGTNYGNTGGPVSGAKRYPYNSVMIEAYNRPKRGQTGIARLRVRSAATVITDLAQKFQGIRKTRPYNIRLFGGPEISRSHTTSYRSTAFFIRKLGAVTKPSKKKKSRNVYPGFDKAYPAMKIEAEIAIQKAVRIVQTNIDRTTR